MADRLADRAPATQAAAAPARYALCGHIVHAHYPLEGLPTCDAAVESLGQIQLRRGEVPLHLENSRLAKPGIEVSPDAVLIKPYDGARNFGRILVREGREIVVAPDEGTVQELQPYILGSAMGAICLQKGLLPLHASAVSFGAQAIAFGGPSGAGKSTMAAAMIAQGADQVTDDLAIIQMPAESSALVHHGVPLMKLWPDSAAALGLEPALAEKGADWRPKLHFGAEAASAHTSHELAAIYLLEKSNAPKIVIEPLTGGHAIAALSGEIYRRAWLAPMDLVAARVQDIATLAGRVPCFRLRRPQRYEMLPEVVEAVARHRETLKRPVA